MKAGHDTPFRGFEVYVQTEDGKRLNEYEDPDAAQDEYGKTMYLECPEEMGKPFQLVYAMSHMASRATDTRIKIVVDGRVVTSVCEHISSRGVVVFSTMCVKEQGTLMKYKLSFGKIVQELVEAETDPNDAKCVGEIGFQFTSGTIISVGGMATPITTSKVSGPVNEKLKKAVLDRSIVGIQGVPLTDGPKASCQFRAHPASQEPYVLKFKYLSRQLLMAKGIIKAPASAPKPPPLTTVDPNTLDPATVKQEAVAKSSQTTARIKRERVESSVSRSSKKNRGDAPSSETNPFLLDL